MITITTPTALPSCALRCYQVKDEADALKVANGRRAWMRRDALGAVYVYVEAG